MSRHMQLDNVKIYRYLTTTTAANGIMSQRAWGPYATKVALSYWRAPGAKLKIELQQLQAVPDNEEVARLEWVTLKVTVQEDELDG